MAENHSQLGSLLASVPANHPSSNDCMITLPIAPVLDRTHEVPELDKNKKSWPPLVSIAIYHLSLV